MQKLGNLRIIAVLLIGTLILSIIGFYNGYPLVYSDTGTYIYSGFLKFIPNDRPITYGLFINFFSLRYSLWLVIFVQNFITALVLYVLLTTFKLDKKSLIPTYYSILILLVFTTGIAWYSNQIMPDFFAPITIILIYILLRKERITWFQYAVFSAILIFSLIVHFSHLLIGFCLITIILILEILNKLKLIKIRNLFAVNRMILVFTIVIISWILLPTINYKIEKKFIFSKASHVFLMAHLNDTGILKLFLDEKCGKPDFENCKFCEYKDSLPTNLSEFLWESDIVNKTNGLGDGEKEYWKIIKATLYNPKYLALNLHKSLTYGMVQLFQNNIGQGLSAYNKKTPPYEQIKWWFSNEINNYKNSRQNKWNGSGLNLSFVNKVHQVLLIISFLITMLIFSSSIFKKIDFQTKYFLIFVILAIVLNAFVTAGLNAPCERFQARVVWILPLSLIILFLKNYSIFKSHFKKSER